MRKSIVTHLFARHIKFRSFTKPKYQVDASNRPLISQKSPSTISLHKKLKIPPENHLFNKNNQLAIQNRRVIWIEFPSNGFLFFNIFFPFGIFLNIYQTILCSFYIVDPIKTFVGWTLFLSSGFFVFKCTNKAIKNCLAWNMLLQYPLFVPFPVSYQSF